MTFTDFNWAEGEVSCFCVCKIPEKKGFNFINCQYVKKMQRFTFPGELARVQVPGAAGIHS